MTAETITRAPLSVISMPAAQPHDRRTSARLADAPDDEGPPAKKTKLDKLVRASPPRMANGKKSGAAANAKSSGYDRGEGDFMFKKKGKGTATAKQADAAQAVQPIAKADAAPQNKTAMPEPPRRRSKRLSGEDSDAKQPAEPPAFNAPQLPDHGRQRGRKRDSRGIDTIHVERKRGPTKIALPFADSPVIERNREMRQASSENRRRSSSSMRGRRASSLIDSGTSSALPHDSIEIADFYKHISLEIPEARRMKQLMMWCGARVMPARPGSDADTVHVNAALAARTIQEELLSDIANKSEMTDWVNRPEDIAPAVLVRKANPRNLANAAKLEELEAEVQRLEKEKAQWDSLLGGLSGSMADSVSATPDGPDGLSLDIKALDDEEQTEIYRMLRGDQSRSRKAHERIAAATEGLEFAIDSLAAGVHKVEQLGAAAGGTAARVMKQAHAQLEERARRGEGDSSRSAGELLRAFSRAGG